MRKKNIARAGAAFVLLLGLTGTTVFYQGTATASGAENSEKVAAVNDDASDRKKKIRYLLRKRQIRNRIHRMRTKRKKRTVRIRKQKHRIKQWIRQIQKKHLQ
mgnify:CR=1 FL=1